MGIEAAVAYGSDADSTDTIGAAVFIWPSAKTWDLTESHLSTLLEFQRTHTRIHQTIPRFRGGPFI